MTTTSYAIFNFKLSSAPGFTRETRLLKSTYDWSRVMRAFVCLLFVLAPVAQSVAQTPPRPGILHSVTVKGNRLYSSEDIVRHAGLKIGQPVSAPVIEKARLKLQQTELFTNVADQYRTTGNPPQYDLTFELTEIEQ